MVNMSGSEPTSVAAPTCVFRRGAGIMFLGAWFLLLGLVMGCGMIAVVIWLPFPAGWAGLALRAGILVAATLPLAVAVLGFLLTFGGETIRIDRAARTVNVAYGRWWCWKRVQHSLDECTAVTLTREIATSPDGASHDSSASYVVRMEGSGDELELATRSGYRAGRALAEELAGWLQFLLRDATLPVELIRAAEELDESLRERALRLGEDLKQPQLPKNARIQATMINDEAVFDLPRMDGAELRNNVIGVAILLGLWIAMSVPGIFALRRYFTGNADGDWQALISAAMMCVPLLPVVYVGLGAIVFVSMRERVIVTSRGIRRIWRFPIGRWTRRLAANDIEELVATSGEVIARTDHGALKLGFALRRVEVRWLRNAVKYVLVHSRL